MLGALKNIIKFGMVFQCNIFIELISDEKSFKIPSFFHATWNEENSGFKDSVVKIDLIKQHRDPISKGSKFQRN